MDNSNDLYNFRETAITAGTVMRNRKKGGT